METKDSGAPRLVQYDNYRGYLRDWYQHSKSLNSKVSFRFLSQRTGLKSPNYWKLIMEGDRKLSNEMIPRFARTLKLEDLESHYFHHLVLMNQAEGLKERALHAQHLEDLKKRLAPMTVDAPNPSFYTRWYLPILRETAVVCGRKNSIEEIQKRLRIELSAGQIEEGLGILIGGGYLQKNSDATYSQTLQLLSTGDRVSSALASQYISRTIEESVPALENLTSKDREFAAQTLSLNHEQFEKLRVLAREFRKEALALSKTEVGKTPVERVVQMNLQIFSLTRPEEESDL